MHNSQHAEQVCIYICYCLFPLLCTFHFKVLGSRNVTPTRFPEPELKLSSAITIPFFKVVNIIMVYKV